MLGVSHDSVESHCAFRDKFGFNFPLVSDPEHAICDAYGVWGGSSARRTTFVIGPDSVIKHVFEKVTPTGHAKQVLAVL